jgi:probable addiction module antidote protein
MVESVSRFDVADYLDNEEMIAEYLTAILEDGDSELLIAAIGDVAKARGMSRIATETGLGRESLYKSLAHGAHPKFDTICKVLAALNVRIHLTAAPLRPKKSKQNVKAKKRTIA